VAVGGDGALAARSRVQSATLCIVADSYLVAFAPGRHQQGVSGPGLSLAEVAVALPTPICSSAGAMDGIGYPIRMRGWYFW
jgi:hypothetical protein